MSVTGESVRVTLCGAPPEAAGLSVFATASRAGGQPCLSINHHRRYEWTRRWLVHAVQVDDDDVQARCQGSRSRAQQTAIRDKEASIDLVTISCIAGTASGHSADDKDGTGNQAQRE